jgi:Uncharacterised protein family UPF0102
MGKGADVTSGSRPSVQSRGTARPRDDLREARRASKVRVQAVPFQPMWLLLFPDWTYRAELARWLFKSGKVPRGMRLDPTDLKADSELALRWTLSWSGSLDTFRSDFTPFAMQLYARTGGPGEEFPEDTVAREQEQREELEKRRKANSKFLPALGMTAHDAFQKLSPGAYLAALNLGVIPIARTTSDRQPLMVAPYRNLLDGQFVWLGTTRGELTLEVYPISDNPQFWRDITWYLARGMRLSDAVRAFGKQWDEISQRFLAAFALSLATAPAIGPRLNVEVPPSIPMLGGGISNAERMVGSESRQTQRFSSFFEHIDPNAAAQVGVSLLGMALEEKDPDEIELDSVNDGLQSSISSLHAMLGTISGPEFYKRLNTGQLGEQVARKTLERRGYIVVAIQNEFGHGIDLVAFHPKKNLLIFVEVKGSEKHYRASLSRSQKQTHDFVRSRLERATGADPRWERTSPEQREAATRLLGELNGGRPIHGVRMWVRFLGLGVNFLVDVRMWRPPGAGGGRKRGKKP